MHSKTIIASILQRRGYWTLTSLKAELTKAEKREIGRHSSPRWELDVVAYGGKANELLVVECKSFLDSPGVESGAFDGSNPAAPQQDSARADLGFNSVLRLARFVEMRAG